MSNLINKVKDAVSGNHTDTTTGHSTTGHPTTHNTHSSTTSYANDPHTGSTNHGPHNTNIANKIDPRVDSDLDGRAGTGKYTSATNAGPHDSNVGNKLDPRVDSDRDGSARVGQGVGTGYGTTGTHTGTHGTGVGSTHTTSTNHGPHDSNLLNKADPRVDSDRDGSRNFGAATGATGASAYGNTGYTGTGTHHTGTHTTGTHATGTHTTGTHTGAYTGTTGSTNHGPHDSNLLNKADPRVDSDRDGSRNFGAASGATGASAYGNPTHTSAGSHSTNHGPHDSNLANKADPRVDSDRDGSRNFGAASGATGASAYTSSGTAAHAGHGTHNTTGTGVHTGTHGTHNTTGTGAHTGAHGVTGHGPAPNTAGPHKSDLLNKIDPRVDSDLDGSKTIGKATY